MTSFTFTLLCLFRFFILFFHVLFHFFMFIYYAYFIFSCFSVYYYIFIWFLIFDDRRNRAQRYKKKTTEVYSFTYSKISSKDKPESHNKYAKDQCMCRPVQVNGWCHSLCEFMCAFVLYYFFLVSSIPSAFTLFMPTLSRGSHSWERDLLETYHFPLTTATSFILCIMSDCGLLCLSSSADRAHRLGSILIWQKVRELEVISVPSRLLSTVQMTGVTNIQN